MNWKILLGSARVLFWVAAIWMLLRDADAKRSASMDGYGRIQFSRNGVAFLAWILITTDLAWWAIRDFLSSGGKPFGIVNGAGLGLLVVLFLADFPGTIVTTSEGLEQLYWLRRNKRIQWRDIVEVNTGAKSRTVTITGSDGTKIVHSTQLADRPRLLLELKQYSGDNLPPDFPREPLVQPQSLT